MEAPASDDASAAEIAEAAARGIGATADQAPEPTAEPTAEATALAAPSDAEEKPKTLLQALGDQSNRSLAVICRINYRLFLGFGRKQSQ